jgi:hypothetical protein
MSEDKSLIYKDIEDLQKIIRQVRPIPNIEKFYQMITLQSQRIHALETCLTECLESVGKAVEHAKLNISECEDDCCNDTGFLKDDWIAIEALLRTTQSRIRLAMGEKPTTEEDAPHD